MATKKRTHVLRPLALLLLVLAGLFTYVTVAGLKPRQGLDLRGGTSVILIPDPSRGQPSKASLEKAVDIIRQRVDGTGVSEAEVVVEGGNIRVALPDVGREKALGIVGTTAELTFRHVEQAAAPGPVTPTTPTPTPSGSATPRPSGSPAPSPSAVIQNPTPSATSNGRPVNGALLGAQASASPSAPASPSPSGTPAATPPATPSVSPSPGGGLVLNDTQLLELFTVTDCTDEAQRDVGQRFAENAPKIIACDRDGTGKFILGPAELKGTDVQKAVATLSDPTSGISQWIVELQFKREGSRKFAEITQKYVNQQVAIVLDGVVQSAPSINEQISGGQAQITGDFTSKEANDLANVLKYGALPVVFDEAAGQTQTISPTLGEESLRGGVLAGLLGLSLVVVYSLLYYRALGLVTVVGLGIFAAFNYLLIVVLGEAIGFTLTLAGIAGLIVSVGISADSYVVFYERLKDEAREGRTLRQSVDRGFKRAFATLLAADFVSLLAAVTLYLLSVGSVRGFAFTLGMATILDVIMAWFYTRPVVTALARSGKFHEGRMVGLTTAPTATSPKEA